MISQAHQWLREELADDREAIADKSPTDWLVTIVDIIAAPVLTLRASIASCIWAINHGDSADIGFSLADPAMVAPAWARIDAFQVVALMAIVPALAVESPACCSVVPPGVAAFVGLQGLVVAVEGVVVISGVRL